MSITDTQKENLKLAVAALKANPKKAKERMNDEAGGRCCLCVMQDSMKEKHPQEFENLEDYHDDDILPHSEPFTKLFGFGKYDKIEISGEECSLDGHNDGNSIKNITEKTHVQIAEAIEKTYNLV